MSDTEKDELKLEIEKSLIVLDKWVWCIRGAYNAIGKSETLRIGNEHTATMCRTAATRHALFAIMEAIEKHE